uniref:Altered inheritance of mitochondria protein 24, mitochondrial n=1 Tax=Alexandrium catenella TaxID=2925 RepID=A0A7S1RA84_ALECA|mmetsp:Transcript_50030/g.133916  ORF Transcript_50030/g.133916 Transcript_50030/m.133916 type:complete len:177 (+) Transcript_50030:83-613(+)
MARLACIAVAAAVGIAAAAAGGGEQHQQQQQRTSAMDFLNAAGNTVTLMKGCESWGKFAPGEGKTLEFPPGENKLWVLPDGCTQKDGCYPCNLDCLGCFYVSATVSGNGDIVTGIGYGHNDPVNVHFRVGNATFAAKNQWDKDESVTCSVSSCKFEHIIQAKAGTGKFTVGFMPMI